MMRRKTTLFILTLLLITTTITTTQAQQEWHVANYGESITGTFLPIYPINELYNRRLYTEEDGGYTYHILLKKTVKVLRIGGVVGGSYKFVDVDFGPWVIESTVRVVKLWNQSIRFAAENFEWARHLSKLRLKIYVEGINHTLLSAIPDVIVDFSTLGPCERGCTYFERGQPIKIFVAIDGFSHELGHALGIGDNYYIPFSRDSRGFVGGKNYPTDVGFVGPPDSFVLYALALRFNSLKNSTAYSRLVFEGTTLHTDLIKNKIPYIAFPADMYIYSYRIYDEVGDERNYEKTLWFEGGKAVVNQPVAVITSNSIAGPGGELIPISIAYGSTYCYHPGVKVLKSADRGTQYMIPDLPYPFIEDFRNNTRVIVHGMDIYLAKLAKAYYSSIPDLPYILMYAPEKLIERILHETQPNTSKMNSYIIVVGSAGPGWDKVNVTVRDGKLCLENIRDRLLIEYRVGRAYRVHAGPVDVVAVKGWSYVDGDGTAWVLRNSEVYFRPKVEWYETSPGARMVWRGLNKTYTVTSPLSVFGELWKEQYLVEVDSPYPFEGVGWYDKGSKAVVKPSSDRVVLENGTALVFRGFEGYEGIEITIDRPLKLKPVWQREYRLDVESRYVFSDTTYYNESERVFVVMPWMQDFGNGTAIELINMTAYNHLGQAVKWVKPLGNETYPYVVLKVEMTSPLKVVAFWKVSHMVTVTTPFKTFSTMVEEGTPYRLDFEKSVELGNGTRLDLAHVYVDGVEVNSTSVTVVKPIRITAEYRRSFMVTVYLDRSQPCINHYLAWSGHVYYVARAYLVSPEKG